MALHVTLKHHGELLQKLYEEIKTLREIIATPPPHHPVAPLPAGHPRTDADLPHSAEDDTTNRNTSPALLNEPAEVIQHKPGFMSPQTYIEGPLVCAEWEGDPEMARTVGLVAYSAYASTVHGKAKYIFDHNTTEPTLRLCRQVQVVENPNTHASIWRDAILLIAHKRSNFAMLTAPAVTDVINFVLQEAKANVAHRSTVEVESLSYDSREITITFYTGTMADTAFQYIRFWVPILWNRYIT